MRELAVVAVCVAAFLWVVSQIYTDMREHEEEAATRGQAGADEAGPRAPAERRDPLERLLNFR